MLLSVYNLTRKSLLRSATHVSSSIRFTALPPSRAFSRTPARSDGARAAPTHHLFLVYAPDSDAPGTLTLRYSVRQKHLEAIGPLIENGTVQVGGMTVTPDSLNVQPTERKALGSILIVRSESLEEVKGLVESDIYYTSGVWDKTKLQVLPFFAATKFPA